MERGPGGGLEERGGGGLWRRKGWETLGSQTPTKTDGVGGQTASGAWAGTAHCWIGGSTFAGAALALPPRRSLWRTCSDTVCASSPSGCLLDARNTSGGLLPGGGVEE